jgi:hypothetical protein
VASLHCDGFACYTGTRAMSVDPSTACSAGMEEDTALATIKAALDNGINCESGIGWTAWRIFHIVSTDCLVLLASSRATTPANVYATTPWFALLSFRYSRGIRGRRFSESGGSNRRQSTPGSTLRGDHRGQIWVCTNVVLLVPHTPPTHYMYAQTL